jgi:hypothetical protein
MSLTYRVFFVEPGDRLRRVSNTRFNRLYFRHDVDERFPEYAGQGIRHALVIVEIEDRKPVRTLKDRLRELMGA